MATTGENLRQEILQWLHHHCIPLSSQSLSDTEIHPGNLDKTSCHRAGWQLKVYLNHSPIPHVKQKRNGTNHHFHVLVLWNSEFLQSILKGWVDPQNTSDLKNSTQLPLPTLLDLKQSAHYAWEAWGASLKPGKKKFLQCFRKKCLSHCNTASVRCNVKSMNKPQKMPCDDDCLFLEGFNEKNSFFCM